MPLLGPPEICLSSPTDGNNSGDDNNWRIASKRRARKPRLGFTKNGSLTYVSTGNPCLDFFFHVVPEIPPEGLTHRLEVAWNFDPLTTLKLICNLRGVRGTGKSDKEGFYTAALWLHKHHPKTLASNVSAFADFGYFKDLLEILYRLREGPKVRSIAKNRWLSLKKGNGLPRKTSFLIKKRRRKLEKKKRTKSPLPRKERVEANLAKVKEEKERARVLRKEKDLCRAKKAFERYSRDPVYRFLHDQISELFAQLLKSDIEYLNSGEINKIGLASKWCPTIDSSYNKSTLICESIARRVFPRESYPEYDGIEEAHYVYRVRKQILVPLHKVLELPEVYMSSNGWDLFPYNRIASEAMKKCNNLFAMHDNKRFKEYLEEVKHGKATIAAGALLPHEIIASLSKHVDGREVAEHHWQRMVEDVSKKGKLRNCIAICNVSGSMLGRPMEVCVALGLLTSELSEDPWKGKVITFSKHPQLHMIKGDSLLSKTEFVRPMNWGENMDFQKVFDQILRVAVKGKPSEDQMIKRVFVFSDMEFDEASGNYGHTGAYHGNYGHTGAYHHGYEARERECRAKGWETDYEVIGRKFRERGYNKVPEIVFWNLSDSLATPVAAKQSGVVLLSGFSKNLVTLFLEGDGIFNPEDAMKLVISREEYEKLVVYD